MSKIRKYIDIGANLTDLMYTGVYNGTKKHDPDLNNVLKRCWDIGMEKIIITGGNLEESIKALEIANTDSRLYCTVGCHPTRCLEFEQEGQTAEEYLNKLKVLVKTGKEKVVAIGECGLDYDRTQFCPIDVQKKYFEMQLKLSEELKIPLFLHCRNAADDLLQIINKFSNLKGVIHSFDGTTKEAKQFTDKGYFIGLNGCSLKTKENLETVASLQTEFILLETDCPWCEIRPSHAGYKMITKENQNVPSVKKEKWIPDAMVKSRNEPSNISHILDVVAAVRKEDPIVLSQTIYNNSINLFFTNKN